MATVSWHVSAVEVRSFKSFTGRQWAAFYIPDRFVGVLGPNGSGKSNLLEAICFAVGCSHSLIRGCRTLKDVTSTDAGSQSAQVKLQLSQGKGSRARHHQLETSLTPEGTRAYKLDGRIKTGMQVKDFLRSCGILIDATTVIQQASVTRLTDSNNPATLAELVSVASGLSSWHHETAAARQEIIRTRKALQDIQNNIRRLSAAATADEAAVQAGLEANRLQEELEQLLTRIAHGIQKHAMFLQQQASTAAEQQHELQAAGREVDGEVQQLMQHKQQVSLQQVQLLAELDTRSTSSSASHLAGAIAAAQSEIAILQSAGVQCSNLTNQLTTCRQQLAQQECRAQQLEGLLQQNIQAAKEVNSSLAAVQAGDCGAQDLQKQVQQLQKQITVLAGAVRQQQQTVSSRVQELQQVQADTKAAAQKLQTLPAPPMSDTVTDPVRAAAAEEAAAAAELYRRQQCVTELQQQVLQLQMDAQVTESSLSSQQTMALLASCNNQGSGLGHYAGICAAPLHACFRFRCDEADEGQLAVCQSRLTALAIIAGPALLQVLVADSSADANQLLSAAAASNCRGGSGGKLKIWPLDNIKAYSNLHTQRAAQQQLGSDKVVLPLDLLDFDKKYAPAMQRAFGGYVIAADDATAAKLVQQFGLSSVTLQGTVSKKGSMSGGWTGSHGSYGQQYWSTKLQYDVLTAQLQIARQRLQQRLQEQQQLELVRSAAEQKLAAAKQQQQVLDDLEKLQAAQAAAEQQLQTEQQNLQEMTTRYSELQARLMQCTAAMQDSGGDDKQPGRRTAAAAFRYQLEQDAARAAAAVLNAQQQLAAAQEEVEALSAQIEALEIQQREILDPQLLQQQLQEQLQHLQALKQQQQDERATTTTLREQYADLQQKLAAYEQQLKELQKQQLTMQQQLQQANCATEEASADLKLLERLKKQVIRDFADCDAVLTLNKDAGDNSAAAHDAAGSLDGHVTSGVTELQEMLTRAQQLHRQVSTLVVPDLPAAQQEACQSRLKQIAQFKDQAAALESAAAGLESRILASTEQVHAASDVVYEDIAAGFCQLCSTLLPSLEIQLERTDRQAHEGLRFRFCRLEDTAADSSNSKTVSNSTDWQTNLGQLSGGQQTLVSLAMLLAVARAGNSSRLFLLDEVDAALDEHNQARAAAFLKHLANAADGGCQILCVTHNAAFQQLCDGYVHVARGPDGGTVPAPALHESSTKSSGDSRKQPGIATGKAAGSKYRSTESAELLDRRNTRVGSTANKRSNKKVRFDP